MKKKRRSGFSFIELILYVSIVTIIISAILPFAWSVIQGGVKSSTQQEVFSQARSISERIKYEIRNASAITSVTSSSITLASTTVGSNPTVIDLSAGKVRIRQAGGQTEFLNSADTIVTNLTFTNYSSADTKSKHIVFTMTLASSTTSVRSEYQETITLESSAELRSN